MQVSLCIRTRPFATLPRIILIIVIIVVAAHWAPGLALPLSLGGWLGCFLRGSAPARARTV
jgi:hypothetical protein